MNSIGMKQLVADSGENVSARLFVDPSAAIGVMHRQGNGRLRHVRVGSLWIQQSVDEGEIDLKKVKGELNPADLLTKNVNMKCILLSYSNPLYLNILKNINTSAKSDK